MTKRKLKISLQELFLLWEYMFHSQAGMKLKLPYYCTSQEHATTFSAFIAIVTVQPMNNVMKETEYFVLL
jgi:hypothetical protein